MSVKAWRAIPHHVPELAGIVAATSRGKATAQAVRAAKDAGYEYGFASFSVLRAPEYDAWAESAQPGYWAEEFVREAR